MAWKSFFYLFGMSRKIGDSAKGLRCNYLAYWSVAINAILLIFVAAIVVLENIIPTTYNDHFLRYLALQALGIVALFELISVQVNGSYECQFWKLHDRLGVNFCKYKPTRSFKFKMFVELSILVLNLFAAFYEFLVFGLIEVLDKRRYFPYQIALRIYLVKFFFFIEVLAFQLDELNRLVFANRMKESAKQLKLCWQMKKWIHKIFGWSLAFHSGLLLIAAVNVLHMLYENLGPNSIIIVVFQAYIQVYFVGFACQIIGSKLLVTKKLLFLRTRSSNEMFAVQLHHQNLEVSPLQICKINNQFVASVCSGLCTGTLKTLH